MPYLVILESSYNADRLDRTIKGFSRLSYKLLAKETVQILWLFVSLVHDQ